MCYMWVLGRSESCKSHSQWCGYREKQNQKRFEDYLSGAGFNIEVLHTSGHATLSDIKRVITGLEPKQIIPINTMAPDLFIGLTVQVFLKEDGEAFYICKLL